MPTPRPDPRSIKLFRQFMEQMMAQNVQLRLQDDPSAVVPPIDGDAIWAQAEGATTYEAAMGMVAWAAYSAVRDGSVGRIEEGPARVETGRIPDGKPRVQVPGAAAPRILADPPVASRPSPYEPSLDVESEAPLLADSKEDLVWRTNHRFARRQGLATVFGWVRNLGVVILLFVAWQLWGTSISQHHDQHQLQATFQAEVRSHDQSPKKSSDTTLIPADQVVPTAPEGTVVAQLRIPAIDLSEYVVSGTAEGDLAKGPGHYIGTAAPGQAGNVAIAGHRTTNGAPFNQLGQLAVGNQIYLTTTSGEQLTYVVSKAPYPVPPTDVAVLDDFGDNRITLTTCNPEFSSSQRLIVVGKLLEPTPVVTKDLKPHAYHLDDSQTASWDWSPLPIVVLEAGFLVLLGLSSRLLNYWYGRTGRWLILTPIWLGGLYLLFQSLASFLPASV